MCAIPYDVLDLIIGTVARDDGTRPGKDLQACSLTCKALLPLSRKHLFATISFLGLFRQYSSTEKRDSTAERFNEILDRTLEIAPCIRAFGYQPRTSDYTNAQIPRLLQRLTNVRDLFLHADPDSPNSSASWGAMPAPLLSAVLRLMHLPTVTSISVTGFTEFDLSALEMAPQLEKLSLWDIELLEPDCAEGARPLPVPAPSRPVQKARLTSLHFKFEHTPQQLSRPTTPSSLLSTFDFTRLETFHTSVHHTRDLKIVNSVLEACHDSVRSLVLNVNAKYLHAVDFTRVPSLQDLNIRLEPSEYIWGPNATALGPDTGNNHNIPFDLSHLTALRALTFTISNWGLDLEEDEDFVQLLAESLRNSCRTKNLKPASLMGLTSVSVCVFLNLRAWYEPCYACESWRALDAVLADSTRFPALRDVTIEVTLLHTPDRHALGFHKERYDRFPGLVSNKAIEFDFHTLGWNVKKRVHESLDTLLQQ